MGTCAEHSPPLTVAARKPSATQLECKNFSAGTTPAFKRNWVGCAGGCSSAIFLDANQFSKADPLIFAQSPAPRSARRFPFESSSVPPRKIGSNFISALRKLQDFIAWRRRAAHIVVHQQELAQLALIQRPRWPDRLLATARRFRSRVGVERRFRHVSAARPPADTDAFMRVGFRRDDALSRRSAAPAKACATQIEAAPKKVDRARLADESRAKLLEQNVR